MSQCEQNSGTLVLPSEDGAGVAQAAQRHGIRLETWSANSREPLGAGMPATAMTSFAVNGTPCSGPR